jgi:uncharacterized membrane protein HdeD (DUF308 family)
MAIRNEPQGVPRSSGWGLVLIQGIAAVVLGLLLVAAPGAALVALVALLGVYWLVSGILAIVRIFTKATQLHWFWSLAVGILGIAAGIIVLEHPIWSAVLVPTVLVVVLGINALVMSALNLVRGFGGEGAGYVAVAILDLIIGVFLLSSPLVAAEILPVALGILALIGGVSTIVLAFTLRGRGPQQIARERRPAA